MLRQTENREKPNTLPEAVKTRLEAKISIPFKRESVFRGNSFQCDFSAKNLSVFSCQLRGEALGIVSRLSFTSL